MKRNSEIGKVRSAKHAFSSRVVCSECGSYFGRKTWGSNTKYKKYVWQCNGKYECNDRAKRNKKKTPGARCSQPHLTDAQLEYAFITAFNEIAAVRHDYFAEYETLIEELTDTAAIDEEIAVLSNEGAELYKQIDAAIYENSRRALDQEEYNARFDALNSKYEKVNSRIAELTAERQSLLARRKRIDMFLTELQGQEGLLDEFDSELFIAIVDEIRVNGLSDVTVKFRDGTAISVDVTKA
jgi:chaperonin cofactor prefoldin